MLRDVAVSIGTRPEAIKLMPVVRALERAGATPRILLSGQHLELLDPILAELELSPSENLRIMEAGQSLSRLSARALAGFDELLARRPPELLIVQGDTTTAAMAGLAAFYRDVPVAHVEAGLRTGCDRNPFPEELNRRLLACLAQRHFAPTERARDNLLAEGIPSRAIHVVGNTVIDALRHVCEELLPREGEPELRASGTRDRVLVTSHRRESIGADLEATCEGVARAARRFSDRIQIVFPVHKNPAVRAVVHERLGGIDNVELLEPLPYVAFVKLLLSSRLVVTDSGGVQEEAAFLGIPVVVVRRTTERPEGLEAGCAELVGCDAGAVLASIERLLTDDAEYRRRAVKSLVYGDGHAAERIVAALQRRQP